MVRIVHASDLHLDASYAFLTGKKLTQRREDFLNSLDTVLNCCIEEKADILLIAGDFYDKVNPTNDARYHALNSLSKFTKENNTQIFIVSGNHDSPKSAGEKRTPIDSLGVINRVHIISGANKYRLKKIEDKDKTLGIYFKGYNGLAGQNNPISNLPKGKYDINIAVLHGSLDKAQSYYSSSFKDYAPFKVDNCSDKGFDYFALGHLHGAQMFATDYGIFAYPGCPQRYSFKEAEGDKGVYLIDTDEGIDEDSITFISLPCRELEIQTVELDHSMDNPELAVYDAISYSDPEKLLNIKLTGKILFDVYKNFKISELIQELSKSWFSVKIDKEFQVYDPRSEYEFRDLKTIGPIDEFKGLISTKLEVARSEKNTELTKRYEWMEKEGLRILMELGGETQ